MGKITWGGYAFPSTTKTYETDNGDTMHQGCNGMTLRDYFAAKAMCGTLPGEAFSDKELDQYAKWAYRMADAMLRAREA